jgi:signal transduction histidine kinase
MRIGLFTNFYLASILFVLTVLILLSSRALNTLDDVTEAERQKHRSLQLANELFRSSEDLTRMARTYAVTGDPAYEHNFFAILDIRNGIRPRPRDYPIAYAHLENADATGAKGNAISLMELMRREGFSERELNLLRQSQESSDNLVNLEKQAFAAMKGLCKDQQGNFNVPCPSRRNFAIGLLFGKRYEAEKIRIMVPINQFMLELDTRTRATLSNLQLKFEQQILLILAVLCIALFFAALATLYTRRNILRPLDSLRRQASDIAQGNYSTRCDISTRNEIAELGTGFNSMAEAIEHEVTKLRQVEESLRERLKEINCFYSIRRGMESSSLKEVCSTISTELITAMQFPHLASVKIELDGKELISDPCPGNHKHELQKEITVYGEARGWIKLFYREDRFFLLPEEQNLINVIGEDLGRWLEHQQTAAQVRVEQELRVRDAAIREFAAHLERMREEDRKYIAREIHDELGQLLAALHLEISLLKSAKDHGNERLETIRRNMAELVERANQSVRDVAEHLRPASPGLGIESTLAKLASEFRKHTGISCELRMTKEPVNLDEDQIVAIFRIVQESLTNVTRHSGARRVEIRVSRGENNVIVEVCDNGRGFDLESAKRKKSFGLVGMRERAEGLAGDINITSVPGQGTSVCVSIPISIPMRRNERLNDCTASGIACAALCDSTAVKSLEPDADIFPKFSGERA